MIKYQIKMILIFKLGLKVFGLSIGQMKNNGLLKLNISMKKTKL